MTEEEVHRRERARSSCRPVAEEPPACRRGAAYVAGQAPRVHRMATRTRIKFIMFD